MVQKFPRSRRLHRRSEFQHVYDRGRKLHGRFMTMFVLPNELAASRLGVSATRKLGRAVARSRAKRRLRELFRTGPAAGPVDLVIVPRRELLDSPWRDLQEEYRALLRKGLRPAGAGGRHVR